MITAIRRGDDRAAIHEANLIPPDLLANQPDAYQPYYILREHVIDRLYDQHVGYWEANLQGLSHPSRADRADLLVEYLGLSEWQIVKAADCLAADGKYAIAAELIETAEPKFPNSEALKRAKRFAYLKLMEKNQNQIRSNSSSIRRRPANRRHKLTRRTLNKCEVQCDDPLCPSVVRRW